MRQRPQLPPGAEAEPPAGILARGQRRGTRRALLLLALIGLGGCTGGSPDDLPGTGGALGGRVTAPSTAASSAGQPSPQTSAADLEDIVSAYRGFWKLTQTVDRQPVDRWRPLLATVTTPPLLDQLLEGYHRQRAEGIQQYGAVEPHPTIANITADRASVLDCQDASRSGELDQQTGAIRSVGSARTAFAAVLVRERPGVWKLSEANYLPDPC